MLHGTGFILERRAVAGGAFHSGHRGMHPRRHCGRLLRDERCRHRRRQWSGAQGQSDKQRQQATELLHRNLIVGPASRDAKRIDWGSLTLLLGCGEPEREWPVCLKLSACKSPGSLA